jgi:hypothetical protein
MDFTVDSSIAAIKGQTIGRVAYAGAFGRKEKGRQNRNRRPGKAETAPSKVRILHGLSLDGGNIREGVMASRHVTNCDQCGLTVKNGAYNRIGIATRTFDMCDQCSAAIGSAAPVLRDSLEIPKIEPVLRE